MCRRVECSHCGKPTFAGCGQHVEQVLGDVPKNERCDCREKGHANKDDRPASLIRRILGL
jgi:hypothetical protein